jgi:hypothetical protein
MPSLRNQMNKTSALEGLVRQWICQREADE